MSRGLDLGRLIRPDVPVLRTETPVLDGVRTVLESGLPALPVVDGRERVAGVFGEREFISAVFPGYVKNLPYAGFVSKALDDFLEKRSSCTSEPLGKHMTSDHVDVPEGFSDMQIAETFLHHRVLVVPVVADRRVVGVVTRSDFFRALAEQFLR